MFQNQIQISSQNSYYKFFLLNIVSVTALLAFAITLPGGVFHHDILLPQGQRHDGLPEPGVAEAHEGEEVKLNHSHSGHEGTEASSSFMKIGFALSNYSPRLTRIKAVA